MESKPDYQIDPHNPRRRLYDAQQYVLHQGDPNDDVLYILNRGRLGVFRDDEQIAEIAESNVFFGEMSLLFNEPRTADVRTLTPAVITAYEGGLDRLVEAHPSIALKLLASLARRLERTSQNHAQALAQLHEMQRNVSANEAALAEQSERMGGLEKQNEELKESIETLQDLADRRQQEIKELSQKGGLFGRRKKR